IREPTVGGPFPSPHRPFGHAGHPAGETNSRRGASQMDWKLVPVSPPKIVAIATDRSRKLLFKIPDPDLPGPSPKYGKDVLFGVGNRAPGGRSVGDTEDKLKPQMYMPLLGFALGDETGMAKRLFDKFLAKQDDVYYFEDRDLNAAAADHDNIKYFCAAALGA